MKNMFFFFLMLLAGTLPAQTKYALQTSFEIFVKGTSSLSEWEMKAEQASGFIDGKMNKGRFSSIKEIKLTVPAESLKSGKTGMDANAYKSLKTSEHKEIVFHSNNVKVNKNEIVAVGELTIAGTTKSIEISASCQAGADNRVSCVGSEKIKMTDYNVEPPTAMFGTITTGDEIEIVFNVNFK